MFFVSCNGEVSSPEKPVAVVKAFSVDTTSFDTLQEAVNYLKSKGTPEKAAETKDISSYIITLNQNVTDPGATINGLNSNLRINLQEYTITLTDSSVGIVVDKSTYNVEFIGGTITTGSNNSISNILTNSGNLTLNSTVIRVPEGSTVGAIAALDGSVVLEGTSIVQAPDSNAFVVTNNGKIRMVSDDVRVEGGISLSDNAVLNVDNGTVILSDMKAGSAVTVSKGDDAIVTAKTDEIAQDLEILNTLLDGFIFVPI